MDLGIAIRCISRLNFQNLEKQYEECSLFASRTPNEFRGGIKTEKWHRLKFHQKTRKFQKLLGKNERINRLEIKIYLC